MSTGGKVTRRTWLKELAAFSAVGMPLMLASTAAEAKASKAAVHYRDYPKRDAHVPYVQVLHCGGRRSLRDDGVPNDGGRHDGTRNDGSRSLPSSRRQNQSDGLLRPVRSGLTAEFDAPRS